MIIGSSIALLYTFWINLSIANAMKPVETKKISFHRDLKSV